MKERFKSLIEGFCSLYGLKNPEAILKNGAVVVNHIIFSLVHNETVDPETLFIYCDFGDVPKGREAEAYRAILKTNLLLYNGKGSTFAMSFETERVVFTDHRKITETTPENLLDTLVHLAEKAYEWRATYFLENDESKEQRAIKKIKGWERRCLSTQLSRHSSSLR